MELIWDGKYDASGNLIAAPEIALPFQNAETANESRRPRPRKLTLTR